ncbi:DoxX family protein [Spirosoma sp. KNUC1025]|uniref:DoxX family protein n=1 Tax=Spirosoma sp. KNUC1025 TaxID=2894082 RepID=UPI00386659E0|nr:DoxX family protein [Spirosoma sp. KNUC1025]
MKKFLSAEGLFQEGGLTFVRIVVGLLLIYHGWEVFDPTKMKEYAVWDVFKESSSPSFMVYLGKGSELVAGILLTAGFLTRIACLIIIGTMLYITFFIGHGKFWYEDQHPFMFVLMGLVFFFTGAGKWSLDALFWKSTYK